MKDSIENKFIGKLTFESAKVAQTVSLRGLISRMIIKITNHLLKTYDRSDG